MVRRKPSPLIPSLMIGVLSLVVFWPSIPYLVSYLMPLFQGGDEETGVASSFVMLLLPLSLLLLVQSLTAYSPRAGYYPGRDRQSRMSAYDGEGFGLGTLILLVLYFVLYNYM